MRTIIKPFLAIAAISMFAGCASVYRVSERAPSPSEAIEPVVTPPETRKPVVKITSAGADEESGALAEQLKGSAVSDLVARGFEVGSANAPDYALALSASCNVAADLGDWRVYQGKVDANVTAETNGAILAATSIAGTGERALGAQAAIASLASQLNGELSQWLAKTMVAAPIELPIEPQVEHAQAMITILPADADEDQAKVLMVQRRFMDAVAAHTGIVSCRLVQEIPASQAFVFRVEYIPELFPGGLLNTLVLARPRLGNNVVLEIAR